MSGRVVDRRRSLDGDYVFAHSTGIRRFVARQVIVSQIVVPEIIFRVARDSGMCGLALIYPDSRFLRISTPRAQWKFLWIIFLSRNGVRERNVSRIRTYTSTDPVRPLGDRRTDSF